MGDRKDRESGEEDRGRDVGRGGGRDLRMGREGQGVEDFED